MFWLLNCVLTFKLRTYAKLNCLKWNSFWHCVIYWPLNEPSIKRCTCVNKPKRSGGRSYFPNPSTRAGYDTRSIFKRSLAGFNSEFSFSWTSCLTKAEEPSLPYYLPIAGGRIIGFIPFSRVLVLCEMQSVLSRNWTRVAESIFCDDNHYTTGTSLHHGHRRTEAGGR